MKGEKFRHNLVESRLNHICKLKLLFLPDIPNIPEIPVVFQSGHSVNPTTLLQPSTT